MGIWCSKISDGKKPAAVINVSDNSDSSSVECKSDYVRERPSKPYHDTGIDSGYEADSEAPLTKVEIHAKEVRQIEKRLSDLFRSSSSGSNSEISR
ncbi:MAG: hypothetical protein PQ612_00655 [Rickettsiales bacterium]|nr:hypothetical protein [Pseudomonadota bacterium]MDA0965576.1 hypothetical protein [Pseudomonadota bacterium]MDG4542900.1 hypothetical protein [Rickettsiales bacterium]MDG4544652.1 hypothetical protein [Rickettsiales bacterium]MDG4546774.1 hypothetical protein [Rickettsiales bacterium]